MNIDSDLGKENMIATQQLVTRGDRFRDLGSFTEYERLFTALKKKFGTRNQDQPEQQVAAV